MSDSDAGDDGGIDKEALREELREKYERDEREREATRRMSDLLLKGATMTNAHCGTCGDPLFQQNGTTFCPSCHGSPEAVEGTALDEDAADADGADTDSESAGTPAGGPDADPAEERTPDVGAGGTDVESEFEAPAETDAEAAPPAGGTDAPAGAGGRRDGRDRRRPDPAEAIDRSVAPAASDLETARDSLRRALEKFAGEAAATDDPRYAKACLEAAREASETLDVLR